MAAKAKQLATNEAPIMKRLLRKMDSVCAPQRLSISAIIVFSSVVRYRSNGESVFRVSILGCVEYCSKGVNEQGARAARRSQRRNTSGPNSGLVFGHKRSTLVYLISIVTYQLIYTQ